MGFSNYTYTTTLDIIIRKSLMECGLPDYRCLGSNTANQLQEMVDIINEETKTFFNEHPILQVGENPLTCLILSADTRVYPIPSTLEGTQVYNIEYISAADTEMDGKSLIPISNISLRTLDPTYRDTDNTVDYPDNWYWESGYAKIGFYPIPNQTLYVNLWGTGSIQGYTTAGIGDTTTFSSIADDFIQELALMISIRLLEIFGNYTKAELKKRKLIEVRNENVNKLITFSSFPKFLQRPEKPLNNDGIINRYCF